MIISVLGSFDSVSHLNNLSGPPLEKNFTSKITTIKIIILSNSFQKEDSSLFRLSLLLFHSSLNSEFLILISLFFISIRDKPESTRQLRNGVVPIHREDWRVATGLSYCCFFKPSEIFILLSGLASWSRF